MITRNPVHVAEDGMDRDQETRSDSTRDKHVLQGGELGLCCGYSAIPSRKDRAGRGVPQS